MKNGSDQRLEDLRHVVALQMLIGNASAEQRALVRPLIDDLERRIGPTTSKRRAAALLGISTQALDAWIRDGRIATVASADGTRRLVDSASLIWTAQQIPPGAPRPARHVDRARLRKRRADDFWRLNEQATIADTRAAAAMPLAERIRHIDALNASMHLVETMRDRVASAGTGRAPAEVPRGV